MTLATGASVVSDTAASGGKAVKMTADGRLLTSLSLPAATTSLELRLRSTSCPKSWPNARVLVDGVVVMAPTKVATSSWTVYSVSGMNAAAGTHSVAVALQNTVGPGSGHNCTPILYVDKLTLFGETSPPAPPAPTVSLAASPASVASGDPSVLGWSSTNATSCSASGAWSGTKPTGGSESTGPLTATSAYSLTCTGSGGSTTVSRTVSVATATAWTPTGSSPYTRFVWGDEFNAPAGSQPDPAKWVMKNGTPWNHGLNSYTNRSANVSMDGSGALDLTARRETYTGADGVTRDYTSGAVLTKDKYTFTYGHVESRIWVPAGRGFWSAFWALRWPIGAEIDAMEILGQSPSGFHTDIRNLKTDSTTNYWASDTFGAPSSLATGYHVYGMTWQPDRISWQLDGTEVRSVTPSDLPSNYRWGFNEPEWIILNLGVGGDWPVAPDSTTPFPSRMKVDWVRVYQ